jgi:hypothetical protein
MFSNYECSLFTVLCNTVSLQLYDLLFVPLIPWILNAGSGNFAGSSWISKSNAGSSRSSGFNKPIWRTTGPGLTQLATYIAQESREPCSPKRGCLCSTACVASSSSPAGVRSHASVAKGGHQDTKYLTPVDGKCGALIPSPPPLWGRSTSAVPRFRPGHLQAAPIGETPLLSTSLSPRRARSWRMLSRCGKESILRSFAVGCCWS